MFLIYLSKNSPLKAPKVSSVWFHGINSAQLFFSYSSRRLRCCRNMTRRSRVRRRRSSSWARAVRTTQSRTSRWSASRQNYAHSLYVLLIYNSSLMSVCTICVYKFVLFILVGAACQCTHASYTGFLFHQYEVNWEVETFTLLLTYCLNAFKWLWLCEKLKSTLQYLF